MDHSFFLVYLPMLWFSLQLVCKVTMISQDESFAPIPTNLKVGIYPGLINVTWDCNITKTMEKYIYKINIDFFKDDVDNTLDLHKCFFEYNIIKHNEFILHKGVSIDIFTEKDGITVKNNWTKVTVTPEGENNTAAEDISCVIYNVSFMDCSWSVGKEAPEDTQYSMDVRQNNADLKCQNYRKDSFGRQVGCVLKCQHIQFEHDVYIQVVGLSNQTTVQFTDKIIKPNDYVILEPPRNIQLMYHSNELEIKWEKPNTYTSHLRNCFLYDIFINEKRAIDEPTSKTYYITNQFYSNEKVTVTMRVKWDTDDTDCSTYAEWSRWSDPQILGSDATEFGFVQNHLLIVLGIGTAIVLILVIVLCRRFRIWTKLFPRVPQPSIKIIEKVDQDEIMVQKFPEHDITFMKPEEECVCSYITEISP